METGKFRNQFFNANLFLFLAERCNYIAKFGYCHNVSSVIVCSLRHVCIVTKWLQLRSRSFHIKACQCLNFLHFDEEMRRVYRWSAVGTQTRVGWLVWTSQSCPNTNLHNYLNIYHTTLTLFFFTSVLHYCIYFCLLIVFHCRICSLIISISGIWYSLL